ncbi:MAG: hypothetical protein HN361_09160, partial [Actinobacteria bacterium]|nr:hypothetical protein [Actinomycetota bacterium]
AVVVGGTVEVVGVAVVVGGTVEVVGVAVVVGTATIRGAGVGAGGKTSSTKAQLALNKSTVKRLPPRAQKRGEFLMATI